MRQFKKKKDRVPELESILQEAKELGFLTSRGDVRRWLKECYGLTIVCSESTGSIKDYEGEVFYTPRNAISTSKCYPTPEAAIEEGIKLAMRFIKNTQDENTNQSRNSSE